MGKLKSLTVIVARNSLNYGVLWQDAENSAGQQWAPMAALSHETPGAGMFPIIAENLWWLTSRAVCFCLTQLC